MRAQKLTHQQIRQRLAPPISGGVLDVVIDTDACNAADDQFAIAWLLCSPERVNVRAVYAEPYSHTVFEPILRPRPDLQLSYLNANENTRDAMNACCREIRHIFQLLRIDPGGRVFHGADRFLPDRHTPVASPAAEDLIRRARAQGDDPLYVAAIGAITNVASALLLAPDIAEKLVVVWLGGEPTVFPNARCFNLGQDVAAAQVLLDSGVPLVLVPNATVAFTLTVSWEEVEKNLSGKSAIGSYLADILRKDAEKYSVQKDPVGVSLYYMRHFFIPDMNDMEEEVFTAIPIRNKAWSQRICDLAAAAWLINPGFTLSRLVTTPALLDNMDYDHRDTSRPPMREVTYISRDAVFGDVFSKLSRAAQ